MRGLSGIDDDHAFFVLDGPSISWQPIAPPRIEYRAKLPGEPVAAAFDLRPLHFDMASLDGMNTRNFSLRRLHRGRSGGLPEHSSEECAAGAFQKGTACRPDGRIVSIC